MLASLIPDDSWHCGTVFLGSFKPTVFAEKLLGWPSGGTSQCLPEELALQGEGVTEQGAWEGGIFQAAWAQGD